MYQNQTPNHDYEPWDSDTYRTGSTQPPKKRGGLVAVVLVAVIALVGIISILSIINIRLFTTDGTGAADESLSIDFSDPDGTAPSLSLESTADPTDAGDTSQDPVSMETSPQSQENYTQEGGLSLQQIYEKTIDSVVSIVCTYQTGTSTGTGIILSEDGYIATNTHVVENAPRIQVLLHDGREFNAILIGADVASDLAVLRIEADALQPAQLGDSSVLRVGDSVVAIGDPLGIGLRGTMTDGIVSAINRNLDIDGRTMHLIQTNAALNSGNSGGPLINCYGQVVGINTMKMGDTMNLEGVEGLGFAIPSTTVQEIVNQLISQGYVSGRPTLGITGEPISTFYLFYYRLPEGLHIIDVSAGSSAEAAGIQQGDILISLDGVRITTPEALETQLYQYAPGDTVQLLIYRAGMQYLLTLTVDEAKG